MDVWAQRCEIVRDIYLSVSWGEFCGVEGLGGTRGRTEVDNRRAPPPPRAAAGSYCTSSISHDCASDQPTPDKFYERPDTRSGLNSQDKNEGALPAAMMACAPRVCACLSVERSGL